MRVIFDIETYKNVFTLTACTTDGVIWWYYEVSDWRNDRQALFEWLQWLGKDSEMVGFNNVGFDYPVIHAFIQSGGKATAYDMYLKAQSLISAQDEDRFANIVYPSDRYIKQIDLYKIHHFDNKARMTSLKALEFNMRLDSVEDLPFPVGTLLTEDQCKVLRAYNWHDVDATRLFYLESLEQIKLREDLSAEYDKDFINHNDTKIGAEIFQTELEKVGVQCYEYGKTGRKPRQTIRPILHLNDAILPWIKLETPEFTRVMEWLKKQSITETKGVFDNLVAHAYGLDFVFGTGGLHAAVENEVIIARDDLLIESRDVSSYYPNLAITNGFYPEHLGSKFCEIYKSLYERRKQHKKGSAMNAALKLSLNGTYGKSNDKFSVFFDPLFTLKITLNGQFLLCLLAENLAKVPTLKLKMINTDGLEYTIHPDYVTQADTVCDWWQQTTRLQLEGARYSKLFIRDCNNYLGEFV